MTLLGLDWNATRVRALLGAAGDYALPVPLEPPALELPAFVGLDRPALYAGAAARRLVRQSPHLVCRDFLPALALPVGQGSRWKVGRHTLDAGQAVNVVWQQLQSVARTAGGIVLTLPGYLARGQADALRGVAEKLRLPVLGSVPNPLAAALAAHSEQFWVRAVLVIDADEHALTLTLVRAADEQAQVVETRVLPTLGLRYWHDRLIDAVADLCVWQTRRDPRDNPTAEQGLYEQLDSLLDAGAQQRAIQLAIQAAQWYHALLLQPEQVQAIAAPLVAQVIAEADQLAFNLPAEETLDGIVLTQPAGQLPGLVEAARALVAGWPRPGAMLNLDGEPEPGEDFGEGLLDDVSGELAGALVLPADAPARAGHALGERFVKGELPRGHLEPLAPLPPPQKVDAGPARLHFGGQDYFLREPTFTLGSQLGCQLRFDGRRHPEVAARHCEIVFDHRTFILVNRSRDGTLVNDHPVAGSVSLRAGDWIRLGLRGPAVRFLGQSHRPLPTPA